MNYALILRLMAKDWYLSRGSLVLIGLGGALAVSLLYLRNEVSGFVGLTSSLIALIFLSILLPMQTVVNERKHRNLPFVMSLPISPIEYTTAEGAGQSVGVRRGLGRRRRWRPGHRRRAVSRAHSHRHRCGAGAVRRLLPDADDGDRVRVRTVDDGDDGHHQRVLLVRVVLPHQAARGAGEPAEPGRGLGRSPAHGCWQWKAR